MRRSRSGGRHRAREAPGLELYISVGFRTVFRSGSLSLGGYALFSQLACLGILISVMFTAVAGARVYVECISVMYPSPVERRASRLEPCRAFTALCLTLFPRYLILHKVVRYILASARELPFSASDAVRAW